jgi:hypothetical protein
MGVIIVSALVVFLYGYSGKWSRENKIFEYSNKDEEIA